MFFDRNFFFLLFFFFFPQILRGAAPSAPYGRTATAPYPCHTSNQIERYVHIH